MPRTKKPAAKDKVGYGNPPREGRFQPGHSGNPKGRPRGSRNFRTDLKSTLAKPVKVNQDGKARKISTQKAVLLRLREKALLGDAKAIDRLMLLAQAHNNEEIAAESDLSAEDREVLAVFAARVLSGAAGAFNSANAEADQPAQASDRPTTGGD